MIVKATLIAVLLYSVGVPTGLAVFVIRAVFVVNHRAILADIAMSAFLHTPTSPRSFTFRRGSMDAGGPSAFRSVRGRADLQPHPKRTQDPPQSSPLERLTVGLAVTYARCNPNFRYESSQNPRRVLTKPSKGVKNDGYDNEDGDYILCVNDFLGGDERHKYRILDMLGSGTFGQVVKCQNVKTNDYVAVKVVKNKTAYHNQSLMEVAILELVLFF